MNRFGYFLTCSLAALLTACSGDDVRSTIGLERSAPDEFKVVSRPPLSVPPEFTLRPPLPGDDEIATLPADKLTRSMITGTSADFGNPILTKSDGTPLVDTAVLPVESGDAPSGAESELLSKLGASQKESGIREKLFEDQVVKQKEKEEEWLSVDALNPFAKEKDVLDAKEEVQKLKDEGKPVIGKHLVLQDPKTEQAPVAEIKQEEAPKAPDEVKAPESAKITQPAKAPEKSSAVSLETQKSETEKPVKSKPENDPVVAAPSLKKITLKDVVDENKATKENLAPLDVPEKSDESLINLNMPQSAEDASSDEQTFKSEVNAPLPEVKAPDTKPAAQNPAPAHSSERKMPSKIIIK
jgi:hypothetical protein